MPRGERGVRGKALPQEKLAMNLNFNIVVTRQSKGEEINISPPLLFYADFWSAMFYL